MAELVTKFVGTTIEIRLEDMVIGPARTPVVDIAQLDSIGFTIYTGDGEEFATGTLVHLEEEPGTWWAEENAPVFPQIVRVSVTAAKGSRNERWDTLVPIVNYP